MTKFKKKYKPFIYFIALLVICLLIIGAYLLGKNDIDLITKSVSIPKVQDTSTDSPLCGYLVFAQLSDLSSTELEELQTYTNFIATSHDVEKDLPTEKDLQAIQDTNIKLIIKLDKTVVEDDFNEQDLRKLKDKLDKYKDVVLAIYPIDEPYKPKKDLTEDELRDIVDDTKEIFNDYPIYVNFLNPFFVRNQRGKYPNIPKNIDLLSFDIYFSYPESEEIKYKEIIGKSMDLIIDKAGSRPVYFITKGFGPASDSEKLPTVYQTQWDYELVQSYGLDGLGFYFYDESAPGGKAHGSLQYPNVLAKQKEVCKKIIGN